MKRRIGIPGQLAVACSVLLALLLVGCTQPEETRSAHPFADLSEADSYVDDDSLPFRFPLDDASVTAMQRPAPFCEISTGGAPHKYHAAEDYHRPAGTPVYAMGDGEISYSGRMNGYGWLIIIDHPQANIYSLYGHLSPSRWRAEPGPVEKGELIAYLGDSDENGGSADNPLVTHLHLGVRAGQRADYSGMSDWRWQAGWINSYPTDLGWLQPSKVIVDQEIPPGGFTSPDRELLEVWGMEILFAIIYLIGTATMLFFVIRKDRHIAPILFGAAYLTGGWLLMKKGLMLSYMLFVLGAVVLAVEAYRLVRSRSKNGLSLPAGELGDGQGQRGEGQPGDEHDS